MAGIQRAFTLPAPTRKIPFAELSKRRLSPMREMLYPRQLAFANDPARFKIGAFTRQGGKSTVTSGEAVRDAIRHPGSTWVCMSRGERQSLEWLSKAKLWVDAYQYVIEDVIEDRGGVASALMKSTEIRLQNGSRIIGIPANPDTARGLSGSVIFDEFGYHDKPNDIWAAAFPFTSNNEAGMFWQKWLSIVEDRPLELGRMQRVIVISTFNGKANKFHELYTKGADIGFSVHRMNIDEAIADGMKLDKEQLRRSLDDPDRFEEEFMCIPMDTIAVLLPYELIMSCETPEATHAADPELWQGSAKNPLVMGIDFGRDRDLTVAWTAECMGDVLHTRDVHCMRGESTPDQYDQLHHKIKACSRVVMDYRGNGVGLGDYLVKEFGEYNPTEHKFGKVQLYKFTNSNKCEIFPRMRSYFERQRVRVPVLPDIREDLHSIFRGSTPTGQLTYLAKHNTDGHADRATALALCIEASLKQGGNPVPIAIPRTGRIFAPSRKDRRLFV